MERNRRKRPLPVRLNSEEQQKLAWSMTDLMQNNEIAMPSTSFQAPSSSSMGHFTDEIKVEHIPKKRQRFVAKRESNCNEIVELKLQNIMPECWHCHIGSFTVHLQDLQDGHSSTLVSDGDKAFPLPCANRAEVKVTLDMESIIDNEVGNDFMTHGSTSAEGCLPNSLKTLSLKSFLSVPSDTLLTLENLQKKGLASFVINPKMSVFDDSWDIKVCLCEKALSKMKFASEDVMIRSNDKLIQNLMEFFFKGISDNRNGRFTYWSKETEFTTLYETVMRLREEKGKMKSEKIKTFVAGNKTGDEFCKPGKACTFEMKMNNQIPTRIHLDFEANFSNYNEGNVYPKYNNKSLDSEIQCGQKAIITEEEHVLQSMEVQPTFYEHEVTGFMNSKLLCDFQHEHLNPTLRQYQRKAVQWMIGKENKSNSRKDVEENDLHVLWRRCVTLDNKVIFFNPYNGRLTTERFNSPALPPGGILADEMGLGKTVEVLACILNNPMPCEMPKSDKDEKTESKVFPLSRLEQVLESESKMPSSGNLFNPSDLSESIISKAETLSKPCEQILPPITSSCSSASCTPELPSTSVPPSFSSSVSPCISAGPSVAAAPPSVMSSKLPETPSPSMATSDTTSILPSTPFTKLVLSSQESMAPLIFPSTTSTTTSSTQSVLSSQESIPSPSITPSDKTILPFTPSATQSTQSVLSFQESIRSTSITPSDIKSILPSTPLATPSTQLVLSPQESIPSTSLMASSATSILPSTQSATTPVQLATSSTTLHSTSLMVSSATSILPSMLSTPCVALSSSTVSSTLPSTSQRVPSLLQCSTSETQSMSSVQSYYASPTSSVSLPKPAHNLSSSVAHSNQYYGAEAFEGKSGNKEPLEVDNSLAPKQFTEGNHPLKNSENSTNACANVDKNGLSASLSFESFEPVSNTNNDIAAKTTSSSRNNRLISAVGTDSPPAILPVKCICGSTGSNVDDVLLKCNECSALSHASCLGHSVTYQQTEAFLCPNCAVNRPPIPSRATLIISPATIAYQWVEEITRHTTPSALRVLVYEGVAKQGFVQPEMLADHDVILTTYATLRADFNHLGTQQGRSLRYQKRYMALPSPLIVIKFWRICLDEAQMVESTTAKAAEMALRLDCVNRWCVTGTPIQKGLEDLYGLLLFLGVFPYCQKIWWNKLLYEPYLRGNKEPMFDALADILWRTAKKNVLDEIHLPSQTEIVVQLNFTPVEEHFYRRQHEECSTSIHAMLKRFGSQDVKLNSLDRNTVHRMLIPLLRLRQACCHPQVVRGGFLSMQKSTMTMDQLLEVLITRAKLECEEAHRQLLFAINGLAGIHTIKEEWPEAVELYRASMRSWMEHEDKFRTDALQKLHTLHNLSDMLSAGHPGCSHTLRDDKLKDEAEELVKQYMTKPNTQVQIALDHLAVAQTNIEELLKKVQFQTPWWLLAADSVHSSGLGHELINRVKEELSAVSTDHNSILNSFTDIHGLGFTVTTKLDVVESTHSTLVQALDKLRSYPTPEMVHATAVCCLRSRPHRTSQATRCKFCEVDDIFTEYESRLFGHQGMKGIIEEDDASNIDWHRHGNTGGLRAETETEKVLKILFAFIKSHRLVLSVHQDARNHLTFMEARRKEFKFLRNVWFASRERVSSLDELEMCTTKLRLALPGETVNENEKHVIQQGEVEQQKLKFISDRVIARTELRKKIGQYLYLTNLAKSQKFNEGENPDPCPVCTKNLGKEWSVFSCGHCYCCLCVWVLLRQAGIGPRNRDVNIKCPICRFPTLAREISYVCTGKENNDADKNVLVKGSHSTKVEAVVRALLKIKAEDGTAKCLVFSTWQDVLELIGKALTENDINFRHITCGGKRFQTDLHVFKEDPDVPVLLLPLQSGSNGLNIIEATHVLLVEPALNPAHELQAVGRVHRIGQARPTFVHRFIINSTVESRMHSLLNGKSRDVVRTGSKDTENSALTLADLTSLLKEGNDPNQVEVDSDRQEDIEMIT